jgi:hypothetical protein
MSRRVQHCTHVAKIESKLLQTKSKKYLIWTHSTSGTNVDNIPQSCTQEKCQNYGSPRVCWKYTKIFLRKQRMSRAPRSGSVHRMRKTQWRSPKNISLMKEQLKVQVIASVSSTKTIDRRWDVIFNSWRRSNESTCQYMGWNTDLCRFLINSKESKEVSSSSSKLVKRRWTYAFYINHDSIVYLARSV